MRRMGGKWIRKAGNILTVLAVGFIIYRLYKMDFNPKVYRNLRQVAIFSVIGEAAIILGILLSSYAWEKMLEILSNKKLLFRDVYYVYSRANIGKYLPGNVMHYVERNIFAAKHGIGQLETLCGSVFEILGNVISAVLISVLLAHKELFTFLSENINMEFVLIIFAILAIAGIVAALYLRNHKIHKIIFKIKSRGFLIRFGKNLILYTICFMTNCVVLLLSIYAIRSVVHVNSLPLLFSMNTMAWLMGFVMPGVPGGIGVRELVLSTMAAGTEYGDIILIAAVGQRIISVVGDFLAYLLGAEIHRKRMRLSE